MMTRLLLLSLCLISWVLPRLAAAEPAAKAPVDFARDIYPILQSSCLECHGPMKAEGDLRLDVRAKAFDGGASGATIVAGKPQESELLRRISLPADDEEIMPARGQTLTHQQIALVRAWIRQGAKWPDHIEPTAHWAYVKPVRRAPPATEDKAWAKSPIDAFVLAELENESLHPSSPADRATLIRRLSLDLIGLPPSPAEVDAFVSDKSSDAYEKLVDRLLASKQFGVRWARPWLDYARYADSHGFQRDDIRDVWAYRDWVVEALNADMPFDRFTIEQLAGDLLPDATAAQKIATGFNRNAPTNVEAGSDPEETRVNQVFDRVNTLGMVWLGSTLECCQCHDHKYDPFKARDYYSLFAFFNDTQIEADRKDPKVPGSIAFLGPTMALGDPEAAKRREELQKQLAVVQRDLKRQTRQLAVKRQAWETELAKQIGQAPREQVLEVLEFDSLNGASSEVLDDQSVLVSGEVPDKDTYSLVAKTDLTSIRAIKLEALTDPSLPGNGPGRGDEDRPNFVLNSLTLEIDPVSGGESQPVKFNKATADYSQNNFDAAGAIDNQPRTAWAIGGKFHEPHWAVFETDKPFGFASGTRLSFKLEQNFGGGRTIGRVRMWALTGFASAAVPEEVVAALALPADKRTAKQTTALTTFQSEQDPETRRLNAEKTRLDGEIRGIRSSTTLVMEALPKPRASSMFQRGDFRNPGEGVEPNTPGILPPLGVTDHRPTRLDLARWLVRSDNPLVARVAVNRWWAELFGHGLVTTVEDFGIKGQPPTHPALLDWLATEYVEHGWSLKHLLRTIVLSSTYQQSSHVTPQLLQEDDQNLLYARGPRFRLDAEGVRDNALAIAGLLSLEQGGAPIKPFQPDGLWDKVGGQKYDYVVSPGEQKYRRGLYVVLKRGAPYPSFINFDANARFTCRVKRTRSNTPLQALTLMNDPVYVEAAQELARRMIVEQPNADVQARITHAFRLAVARTPKAEEVAVLKKLFDAQLAAGKKDPAAAKESLGKFALPSGTTAEEFAAWYAVATALLNLDETISKG